MAKTLERDALRVTPPSSLDEARRAVGRFVEHCNGVRQHSAIGHVTPSHMLARPRAAPPAS
ncbi:integrase core domain-containing protein [Sorangium sp. So ce118]